MPVRRRSLILRLALLVLCATRIPGAAQPATAAAAVSPAAVAIVAHRAVTQDSLSRSQLLDFYTGDIQRWPDGTPVVLTDLKAKGAVRDGFYGFLGKRPSRMKSIWLRRMLSGEGEPPAGFETEPELLRHVGATPGAIGYVDAAHVADSVRVLLVVSPDEGGRRP